MNIRDRIIEFKRVNRGDVLPNRLNFRRHPEAQKKALRAVLQEVGIAGAALAYYSAANDGKLTFIDGHLRDEEIPEGLPVLVTDLNDDEASLLLASYDPLSAMAETDKVQLDALLREVSTGNAELVQFLAATAKEAGLSYGAPPAAAPEAQVDRAAELQKKWKTERGQLWEIGNHRLLCGDSTQAEDVQRVMAGERAVLFATDPPYAVGYTGTSHPASKANKGAANRNKDWSETYHEASHEEDAAPFYRAFILAATAHAITDRAAWYCWHASKRQAMLESVWAEFGAFVHQQIIWFKTRSVLTYSAYLWSHEPCLMGWVRPNKPPTNVSGVDDNTTVWSVPSAEVESPDHPTSKPPRLFSTPMLVHTQSGDLCFEPFTGSGSQLVAAERLNRRCFGLELEPKYVAVTLERAAAMGLTPKLEAKKVVSPPRLAAKKPTRAKHAPRTKATRLKRK